jgi:hypothetical protein
LMVCTSRHQKNLRHLNSLQLAVASSLSANSSASVDDGRISPPQNQRGVSRKIRPVLHRSPRCDPNGWQR